MHESAEGVTVGRAAADDSNAKKSPEKRLKECIVENVAETETMDDHVSRGREARAICEDGQNPTFMCLVKRMYACQPLI